MVAVGPRRGARGAALHLRIRSVVDVDRVADAELTVVEDLGAQTTAVHQRGPHARVPGELLEVHARLGELAPLAGGRAPTRNVRPTRWLSATPSVTRLRRVSASVTGTPPSSVRTASTASRSISVTSRAPRPVPEYVPAPVA